VPTGGPGARRTRPGHLLGLPEPRDQARPVGQAGLQDWLGIDLAELRPAA